MCNVVTCVLHRSGCSETGSLSRKDRSDFEYPLRFDPVRRCTFQDWKNGPSGFSCVFTVETKVLPGEGGVQVPGCRPQLQACVFKKSSASLVAAFVCVLRARRSLA